MRIIAVSTYGARIDGVCCATPITAIARIVAAQKTRAVTLVVERRHGLQYRIRCRAIADGVILTDLSVAKNDDALRELRDVVFVRDENDRQSLLIQVLEDLHDLDRRSAVEVSGRLVGEEDRWMIH